MVEHVPDKNGVEGSIPSTRTMALDIKENEPLKKHSTFRIGGPAKYFVVVKSEEEILGAIKFAEEKKLPYFIFGNGSNILYRDEGYEGVAIKSQISNLKSQNLVITAGSGVLLSQIINFAVENNLSGLEWGIGIPGTIGGCVAGNCGAFGRSISECVERVKTIGAEYSKEECDFSYRQSKFKNSDNKEIILEVELKLKQKNKEKIKEEIKNNLMQRKNRIPPYPSIGCVFKNPKPLSAGSLIEQCGLKSKKIGGAKIAEEQSNFIVNVGHATSGDVLALIKLCKEKVKEKFSIDLEEEIVIL